MTISSSFKILCSLVHAFALGLMLLSGAAAAADTPPLAKNAKPKPDEFPEKRLERELKAFNVRATVMIGARDYDGLEKMAADWLEQYRAKKIGGDEYIDRLNALSASQGGKNMVADTEAWVAARPNSYAARYALGRLYYDVAWQERGGRYATQTTEAQFDGMFKYAAQSRATLLQSVPMTPYPLASYNTLVRVATITKRSGSTASTLPDQGRFCPGKYAADGLFPSRWDEQLYYLCLAVRADPEAVRPFGAMVFFNSPRWSGRYDRLERLLAEFQGDKRISPKGLGRMKAELLSTQADDAFEGGNPAAAAALYVEAFHAAPEPDHVEWMYKAAQYERNNTKNLDRSRALYSEIVNFRPGEADAIANVAWIDEERGDLRNYLPAMTAAANLGLKEAQNNLGYYYMVGQRGLPRDLLQAKEWLTLAANQGYEHAREKIGVVDGMIAAEKKK